MRLANPLRGRLWYVLYGVCLVFVVSFILFEALDIDGSSLQVATTSAPFALSQSIGEERGDDLHVYATAALLKGIVLLEAAIAAERVGDAPHLGVLLSHHYHIALPRASLSPPPPLA
jgi:hypothetical protein